MKNRAIVSVAAASLAAASLVCASAAWAKPVTIQYWGSWSFISKAEKHVVDNFNKLHEGQIVVRNSDVSDPEAKTLTALAGGAAPDVFKIDRFKAGSFAAKDVLTDLSPYLKKDGIDGTKIFFKPTWNETLYGGKCYALPWNTDSRPLYYNRTMFRDLGFDPEKPPKTWEDLAFYSKKMDLFDGTKFTRTGLVADFSGNWGFVGWLFSAGGNITENNDRRIAWNSPTGIKALTYMTDSVNRLGGPSKASLLAAFNGGKCAMQIQVSDQMRGYKFELGAAAPPRPAGLEDDPVTWSGGFALAMPRGGKHAKEAWEFIKYYCTNIDAQLILGTEGTGQIPVLKAAAYDERNLKASPMARVAVSLLEDGRYRPVVPAGQELWSYYTDAVSSDFSKGLRSPTDILNRSAADAQKVLDRAWAHVRK